MAAQNKTAWTGDDVGAFLAKVESDERRRDAAVVCDLMARLSGEPAKMWGPSIVGFGRCHYRYDSGREGDMPRVGFSPRKAAMVLYGFGGADRHPELIARLGKHATGKGCVYVKRLEDVDLAVLEQLITASLAHPAES